MKNSVLFYIVFAFCEKRLKFLHEIFFFLCYNGLAASAATGVHHEVSSL